jgi:phospholipid transport system substrate-binding protein
LPAVGETVPLLEIQGRAMRVGAHVSVFGIVALFILSATTAVVSARNVKTNSVRVGPSSISESHQSEESEAFVHSNIDMGFAILNDHALAAGQRRTQFRDFLLSIMDARRIAMFTLGNYARDASENDINNFVETYTNFAAALYQSYFEKNNGETLRVTGSTWRSEDDVVVNVDVVGRDGVPRFKIGFRVRKDEQRENVITDLQIEGAWLALNQRADFGSYLQQHGGMIDHLSEELRSRAQRIEDRGIVPGTS